MEGNFFTGRNFVRHKILLIAVQIDKPIRKIIQWIKKQTNLLLCFSYFEKTVVLIFGRNLHTLRADNVVEFVQHFSAGRFRQQADYDHQHQIDGKAGNQGIQAGLSSQGSASEQRNVIPKDHG